MVLSLGFVRLVLLPLAYFVHCVSVCVSRGGEVGGSGGWGGGWGGWGGGRAVPSSVRVCHAEKKIDQSFESGRFAGREVNRDRLSC